MKKGEVLFNVLRVPVDFALLIGSGLFVYFIRTQLLAGVAPVQFALDLPLDRFVWLTVAVSVLFVLVYALSGLYSMRTQMHAAAEVTRVIVASAAAMMLVILTIFVQATLFNSRFLVLGYWVIATVVVVVGRMMLRMIYRRTMAHRGFGAHRVLLIGNDETTEHIATAIATDPGLGYRVVKQLDNPDLERVASSVGNPGVDEIILANPNYAPQQVVELVDFCHDHHIAFTFVPNIHQTLTTNWDVQAIGRTPVVSLRRTALDGWGRIFKRLFDIVFSAIVLVFLSPVFAVIAFAIKWETEGPVFARLQRVSRGREFVMYKFRSMIDGAHELNAYLRSVTNDRPEAGPLWKMKDDPRITRVGRFTRRTRLDELAQFINVFKGDMSVIGPRPHQADEIARYAKHHKKVLAIKAGVSGMAQVSGSSDLPFEEEVVLDTFYIENWSLWLDVRLILRTITKMLSDRSAV